MNGWPWGPRTGMAIMRDDGVVLVAVQKDMMRVIGEAWPCSRP